MEVQVILWTEETPVISKERERDTGGSRERVRERKRGGEGKR